jgi:hypothetical protein
MERPDARLAGLGTAVRELLAFERTPLREIRRARAELLQRVVARNLLPARWPCRGAVLLLAAALTATTVAVWTWARLPITFQVGLAGLPGRPGDLVRAAADVPKPLHFSDGSSLVLTQGGRLRVLTTDAKGARVLLEDGTVGVKVASAKRGKKRWTFEAGPFSVRVTGTRFKLTYRAAEQTFGLETQEGQVVVAGGCLAGPRAVPAGNRLNLACLAKSMPLVPTAEPPGRPLAPREGAAPALATGSPAPGDTWRELLPAGHLRAGLHAAERAGFDRVSRAATSRELLLLADAARLFEHQARAATALHVLRQRFPSSADASTAAFSLGRLAFEQKHDYPEAVRWFATYLREQPGGPLMGDAFGRLMEARVRARDEAGARLDAEQYLRRFPEGPYAPQAHRILSR